MKPCANCILAELDMFALVNAIGRHAEEVQRWLAKPIPKEGTFLRGRDAKLMDFDPHESLCIVVGMLADAQRRAEKSCKSARHS